MLNFITLDFAIYEFFIKFQKSHTLLYPFLRLEIFFVRFNYEICEISNFNIIFLQISF